jgi:hypothetical protein
VRIKAYFAVADAERAGTDQLSAQRTHSLKRSVNPLHEEIGLLSKPKRNASGHRVYGGANEKRLTFVHRLETSDSPASKSEVWSTFWLGPPLIEACFGGRGAPATW